MWVTNMHKYATIHSALVSLTNVEMGRARIRRDATDLKKVFTWFDNNNNNNNNTQLVTGMSMKTLKYE